MTGVINLNKARKARAHAADKVRAAENRVRHGRTKSERAQAEAETAAEGRRLDAHKREPDR
jgi:hypothetical protein